MTQQMLQKKEEDIENIKNSTGVLKKKGKAIESFLSDDLNLREQNEYKEVSRGIPKGSRKQSNSSKLKYIEDSDDNLPFR